MRAVVFRVDPRLVHASLTSAWVPAMGFEWILVADDAVWANPRLRNIYELSAMGTADLAFVREGELVARLERVDRSRPGVVLFSSLNGALAAVEGGAEIDHLRISHIPEGEDRSEVQPGVHLGGSERVVIRALKARGVHVTVQPLPDDPPLPPVVLRSKGENTSLEAEVEVVNERGLHLRAAHVLSEAVRAMPDDVQIGTRTELVNAKSLLGLTTLGAGFGTWLRVVVTGRTAAETLHCVRRLFASGFYEGVAEQEDKT